MSEWIKKKTGSMTSKLEIKAMADLERKTRQTDSTVVYYGQTSIKKFKLYEDLARDFIQQDDIEFVHVDSKELSEEMIE